MPGLFRWVLVHKKKKRAGKFHYLKGAKKHPLGSVYFSNTFAVVFLRKSELKSGLCLYHLSHLSN